MLTWLLVMLDVCSEQAEEEEEEEELEEEDHTGDQVRRRVLVLNQQICSL